MSEAIVSYENPPGLPPAQGLYSHLGVSRGGALHMLAGLLSVGADGEMVGAGSFERQFEQVYANLGKVLKGAGGDYRSIVKMTTYLVHSQDIAKFMTLRAALFPKIFPGGIYPPNTLVVVNRLVREEFLLEVEAVAAM